jgi:hypothetical protein
VKAQVSKKTPWIEAVSLILGFMLVLGPVHADTMLATSPVDVNWYNGSVDGTLGYTFSVGGSGFDVTGLGFYDKGGDGLLNSHVVGIWTTAGSLITSATVSSGTGSILDSGFRWVDLSSAVTLSANTSYVIGATFTGNDTNDLAGSGATISAPFTVAANSSLYLDGAGLNFPTETYAKQGFFGGNLRGDVAAVPEADTYAMMLAGLGLVGFMTQRRKHTHA